jgi:hypothetical protein
MEPKLYVCQRDFGDDQYGRLSEVILWAATELNSRDCVVGTVFPVNEGDVLHADRGQQSQP